MFEKYVNNVVKTVKFVIKMRVTDSHFTYFASANQLPGFSIGPILGANRLEELV